MTYRTVTIVPELTDSIVNVSPETAKNIIDIGAELYPNDVSVEADVYLHVKIGNYDDYVGAYEVTPLAATEQVLDTSNKHMTDDVTVYKVPYFETTNEHGTTVYIAEA